MHNNTSANSTSTSSLEADLVGVRIVSYVAFTLFGVVSTLSSIAIASRVATGKSAVLPQLLSRQSLATALLACGWLFAGLNPLLVHMPGAVWSFMRVLLNAAAWEWTLAQLCDYYHVLEPTRSDTAQPIRRFALALLVLSATGDAPAKFVAMTGALPLAVLVVLCASMWSVPDRAIWPLTPVRGAHDFSSLLPTGALQIRFGHVVFVALALTGVWALVCELLSAEYSGVLPLYAGFALMLPEHAVLVLLWFATAMAPKSLAQQNSSEGRLHDDDSLRMNTTPLIVDDISDGIQEPLKQ